MSELNEMEQQYPKNNQSGQNNRTIQNISWSQTVPEPQKNEAQRAEAAASRAKWFRRLALPSFIYAILYTVFTYDNQFGIGIPAWIAATIVYAVYLLRKSDIQLKKGSVFCFFIMGLLGISTILTTNYWLICCNQMGFCLLLIYFLLMQTRDTGGWSIWEAICGIFLTVIGVFSKIAAPIIEGYSWLRARDRDSKEHEKRRLIFIGILISIPALLILGSLLMSADAVFGNMLQKICLDRILPANAFGIAFTFLFGLFASYCGMHELLGANGDSERVVPSHEKQPALIAQIFTTAILVLYVWFCFVQIVYLFGGFGTLPQGMTYAQYARSGFFQLLFVCLLNLILVLTVKRCFETTVYLNRILFAICLCSYVMTASSAYRMILYIQAYDLTVLRIVVLVALATIAILLAGVCRHIFSPEFRILPYCVTVICTVYTIFSLSHVDSFVARYDLAHLTEENATETFQYLETLSLDALPVTLHFLETADEDTYIGDMKKTILVRYPFTNTDDNKPEQIYKDWFDGDEYRDWFIRWLSCYQDVLTDNGPRTWNISVYRAKYVLKVFFIQNV